MQNYTRYVQTTGQNARKKNRRRKYGAAELIIPSKSCHIRSWLGGIHSYAYACMVTCNASKVDPNPAMHATCLCMFLVISLRKCCWQSQTRRTDPSILEPATTTLELAATATWAIDDDLANGGTPGPRDSCKPVL